jgi:hypothetical protein
LAQNVVARPPRRAIDRVRNASTATRGRRYARQRAKTVEQVSAPTVQLARGTRMVQLVRASP